MVKQSTIIHGDVPPKKDSKYLLPDHRLPWITWPPKYKEVKMRDELYECSECGWRGSPKECEISHKFLLEEDGEVMETIYKCAKCGSEDLIPIDLVGAR